MTCTIHQFTFFDQSLTITTNSLWYTSTLRDQQKHVAKSCKLFLHFDTDFISSFCDYVNSHFALCIARTNRNTVTISNTLTVSSLRLLQLYLALHADNRSLIMIMMAPRALLIMITITITWFDDIWFMCTLRWNVIQHHHTLHPFH